MMGAGGTLLLLLSGLGGGSAEEISAGPADMQYTGLDLRQHYTGHDLQQHHAGQNLQQDYGITD